MGKIILIIAFASYAGPESKVDMRLFDQQFETSKDCHSFGDFMMEKFSGDSGLKPSYLCVRIE